MVRNDIREEWEIFSEREREMMVWGKMESM